VERAEAAKQVLADDRGLGVTHKWRSEVWKGFKEFFSEEIFHGTCAYCEATVKVVYVGDAEHYRPKGKVTQRQGDREVEVTCENGHPHPGYYWLAYDWRNILPSCYQCNTGKGKGTQFPARRHACSPEPWGDPTVIDEFEEPLLLNPLRLVDHPSRYLAFDDNGEVAAKDGNPRAEESIKAYRLKRDGLAAERRDQQRLAWHQFDVAKVRAAEEGTRVADPLREYKLGLRPHSTAALQYVHYRLMQEFRIGQQWLEEKSSEDGGSTKRG
jgi:hypothetical protein